MDSRNHRGSKQQNPSEVEPAPRHVATQQQKAISAFFRGGEPQTETHYPDHFEVNYAAGSAGAL